MKLEGNSNWSRGKLKDLIVARLQEEKHNLQLEFRKKGQINSCYIDNLLPEEIALEIFHAFPAPEEMATHKSIRENKKVAAQLNKYNPLLEEITYAFQDKKVVQLCEEITGISNMQADELLYAGGISLMSQGNFLSPHLDNSHDHDIQNYRVLNLLYYVSPNWKLENGGNLELWDNGMKSEYRTIVSQFNRLVLMITNKSSFHAVSKVVVDAKRCCISNYYFANKPADQEAYFHVTSFYGRPGEMKGLALKLDRNLRNALRTVFKKGIMDTKHIYKKEGKKEEE